MEETIKSQDDIKHQDTRSSDVLIKAVEKCEKLEKENKRLRELITLYQTESVDFWKHFNNFINDRLKELDK